MFHRIAFSIALLMCQVAQADQPISFSPERGVLASAYLSGGTLKIQLRGSKDAVQVFELDGVNTAHLALRRVKGQLNPYVEVWQIDEGNGTYTIHHLFAYHPKRRDFIELQPKCGEQYINLKPQSHRAELVYSAFSTELSNWRVCIEPQRTPP